MTTMHPITLPTALDAIERDMAERRSEAVTYAAIRGLRAATARVVHPAMRRFAPRLAGAA